jgi:hypothetical protein
MVLMVMMNKSNNNNYAEKDWKTKIHWLSTKRVDCESKGDPNNNTSMWDWKPSNNFIII